MSTQIAAAKSNSTTHPLQTVVNWLKGKMWLLLGTTHLCKNQMPSRPVLLVIKGTSKHNIWSPWTTLVYDLDVCKLDVYCNLWKSQHWGMYSSDDSTATKILDFTWGPATQNYPIIQITCTHFLALKNKPNAYLKQKCTGIRHNLIFFYG